MDIDSCPEKISRRRRGGANIVSCHETVLWRRGGGNYPDDHLVTRKHTSEKKRGMEEPESFQRVPARSNFGEEEENHFLKSLATRVIYVKFLFLKYFLSIDDTAL